MPWALRAVSSALVLLLHGSGAAAQTPGESARTALTPARDPSPRFQITAAAGVGGDTRRDEPGVAFGVFGMLRLSRTAGSTVGIPFLLTHSLSANASEAYMTGVHFGDTVYYQLLVGLASGTHADDVDPRTGQVFDARFGIAAGSALGLHLDLGRSFGLNAEAFVAHTFFADSPTAGVLIGPTFETRDKPSAGDSATLPAASPLERGSHLELSLVYSRYYALAGDRALDAHAYGPRLAIVKTLGAGWALAFGARLGGGYGGFDVTVHQRFDRFTGRRVVPYLVAGPMVLFGPSATGNELFVPAVDVLVGAGAGLEFRLTRWSAIAPSIRWYHPLASDRSYTGPMDLTLIWSLDL